MNITGSVVTGGAGFTKALGGNLTFSNTQFFTGSNITFDGGVTTLNAGSNTINPNLTLVVNAGATLDLNGNAQWFGNFVSDKGIVPGGGGTVTTAAAPGPAHLLSTARTASGREASPGT